MFPFRVCVTGFLMLVNDSPFKWPCIALETRGAIRDGTVVRVVASHQCGLGSNSHYRRHMWVEFVVGSLLCSGRFFSGYFGVSSLLKNQHFQIPIRPEIRLTKNHFVDVLPANHTDNYHYY